MKGLLILLIFPYALPDFAVLMEAIRMRFSSVQSCRSEAPLSGER